MSVYTLGDLAGGWLRRDPSGVHLRLPQKLDIVAATRPVGQGAALFNRPSAAPQALQFSAGVHTRPGGGTEITEFYRDGRLKKAYGTAVISSYRVYDKEADGDQTNTVYRGSTDASSDRWVTTTTDPLGRTKLKEKPAFVESGGAANNVTTTYTYDSTTGRLSKVETADDSDELVAPTVHEYDSDTGQLVRTGLDLNDDGDLDLGGTDHINETETRYTEISSDWWLETKQYAYLTDSSSTRTLMSTQRQRLTGLGSGVTAETETVDQFSNVTKVTTTLASSDPLVTVTTDYPATNNNGVRVRRNGLLQSAKDMAQVTTTFGYDAFGRQTTVTDGRSNTTTTHYDAYGRVDYVEDEADNRTTYAYDSANDGGRLQSVKNDNDKYTYYDYNTHGQTTHIWGDIPHPVRYEYDSTFAQRTKKHTYQEGTGWTSSTWPASPGTADTTEYTYDDTTGLLTVEADANTESVTYTYTPDGKLEVRTWARTNGESALTATYSYYDDVGSGDATGQLEKIDYSDSTPDVEYTYTRDGQLDTVDDAVGTRSFTYDTNGQRRLEIFDAGDIFGGKRIRTYYTNWVSYQASEGGDPVLVQVPGLGSIEVGTSIDPDADYELALTYSGDTGDITKLTGSSLPNNGAVISRLSNSHLIAEIEYKQNTTVQASVNYSYHADGDYITGIKNVWGSDPDDPNKVVSEYTYAYDGLWRTTSIVREGYSTFGAFANDHHDAFTYSDRNELTLSKRYNNTSPGTTTNPDTDYDRAFAFDTAANRTSYTEGTASALYYCVDALNLYTTTDDAQTCPPQPGQESEAFEYDEDHNLTGDGTFAYTYDAENRLSTVEPVGTPVSGDRKMVYTYDFLNRRVRKLVYDWDDVGEDWEATASEDCRFVYFDRLLLLELDGTDSNAVVHKFAWGPEPTGSAGLGRLLSKRDVSGSTNYVCFTNRAGSVVQLLDRSNGSIDAKYVYDVNGDTVRKAGSVADSNPLRYLAIYYDAELDYVNTSCDGLYCNTNGTPYSPRLGRSLSQDTSLPTGGSPYSPDGDLATTVVADNVEAGDSATLVSADPLGDDGWHPGWFPDGCIPQMCFQLVEPHMECWMDWWTTKGRCPGQMWLGDWAESDFKERITTDDGDMEQECSSGDGTTLAAVVTPRCNCENEEPIDPDEYFRIRERQIDDTFCWVYVDPLHGVVRVPCSEPDANKCTVTYTLKCQVRAQGGWKGTCLKPPDQPTGDATPE